MKKLWFVIFVIIAFAACSNPKPSMPIEMTYRPALGPGYVMYLKNTGNRSLTVYVKFKRGFNETLKEGSMTIGAGAERSFGWLDGVTFMQGDRVVVWHADFAEGEWSIPKSLDR
jgi:hypothetical protein